ncbi:hypothetical protein D3C87_280350 [compost metagenome]
MTTPELEQSKEAFRIVIEETLTQLQSLEVAMQQHFSKPPPTDNWGKARFIGHRNYYLHKYEKSLYSMALFNRVFNTDEYKKVIEKQQLKFKELFPSNYGDGQQ